MTTHQQDLDFIAYQAFHDKLDGRGAAVASGRYKWGGPDAEEGNNGEDEMFIKAPDGTVYIVEIEVHLVDCCQICWAPRRLGKHGDMIHKMDCPHR